MIKVNEEVVKLNKFPDGTFNIKANPIWNDVVNIAWHYENDSEFVALAFLTKYYQAHMNDVILYLPYVPNARMDRVENPEDIFAMKYFAQLINSLDFKNVYVMDVHSSVAIATINNCILLENPMIGFTTKIVTEINDNEMPILFFPDEGAMKRYSKKVETPFAYGMKKRDWKTGQIIGYDVVCADENYLSGKNVIICDDICSMGGTFYHAAKKLKEMGVNKIYLCVTHCENNIFNGKFGEDAVSLMETGLIECVFTTDSIFTGKSDKVIVVRTRVGNNIPIEETKNMNRRNTNCDGENCDCENECKHCSCNDSEVVQEDSNE